MLASTRWTCSLVGKDYVTQVVAGTRISKFCPRKRSDKMTTWGSQCSDDEGSKRSGDHEVIDYCTLRMSSVARVPNECR
jgi:hypothetical protein